LLAPSNWLSEGRNATRTLHIEILADKIF